MRVLIKDSATHQAKLIERIASVHTAEKSNSKEVSIYIIDSAGCEYEAFTYPNIQKARLALDGYIACSQMLDSTEVFIFNEEYHLYEMSIAANRARMIEKSLSKICGKGVCSPEAFKESFMCTDKKESKESSNDSDIADKIIEAMSNAFGAEVKEDDTSVPGARVFTMAVKRKKEEEEKDEVQKETCRN